MTRIFFVAATAAVLTSVGAFSVVPRTAGRKTLLVRNVEFDKEGHHLTFNPVEGYKSVDLDRAKQCAENFGKCSVTEMKYHRDNLHKERLQGLMLSKSTLSEPNTDELEHRLVEEELDLQVHLLQEQNVSPDFSLFPEVEAPMEELPHLKDNTVTHAAENFVHKAQNTLALEETILGEDVLETLVMCSVVVLLTLGIINM